MTLSATQNPFLIGVKSPAVAAGPSHRRLNSSLIGVTACALARISSQAHRFRIRAYYHQIVISIARISKNRSRTKLLELHTFITHLSQTLDF
jgi:hypothetical protein